MATIDVRQRAEPRLVKQTRPAVASLLESIGNTPLVELRRIRPDHGARILAKLEGHNPGARSRTARPCG